MRCFLTGQSFRKTLKERITIFVNRNVVLFWDPLNRYYSLLVKYKYTILCFSILCLRCKLCPDSGHIIEIQKLLFILELFWSNFIERISIFALYASAEG